MKTDKQLDVLISPHTPVTLHTNVGDKRCHDLRACVLGLGIHLDAVVRGDTRGQSSSLFPTQKEAARQKLDANRFEMAVVIISHAGHCCELLLRGGAIVLVAGSMQIISVLLALLVCKYIQAHLSMKISCTPTLASLRYA